MRDTELNTPTEREELPEVAETAAQAEPIAPAEETAAVSEGKKKKSGRGTIWVVLLVTGLLLFAGELLGGLMVGFPMGLYLVFSGTDVKEILENGLTLSPVLGTVMSYLPTIGTWTVCLLWFLRKKDRPLYRTVTGYCKGNNVPLLLFGFLLGFLMNGGCILAARLHGDISLTYDSVQPGALAAVFLCVFIQSSSEELLCRGYLYQKLRKLYRNPAIAIFGNSLLFALLHLGNPGVTVLALLDIFISGVLFSLLVYYLDSMWCAFAVHTAWNFTQNIVFGLPNSGLLVPFSVFTLDTAAARDSFAYNVAFGVEGTVLAVLIETAVCLLLWLWGRKHGPRETNIWPADAEAAAQTEPAEADFKEAL